MPRLAEEVVPVLTMANKLQSVAMGNLEVLVLRVKQQRCCYPCAQAYVTAQGPQKEDIIVLYIGYHSIPGWASPKFGGSKE